VQIKVHFQQKLARALLLQQELPARSSTVTMPIFFTTIELECMKMWKVLMHYIEEVLARERVRDRETERIKEIESWSGHSLKTPYEKRKQASKQTKEIINFPS
jgi:hypothetical protein